ncbi:MAG: ATP-binding cassette domain-containing protein [Sphingomonas sp.]
MSAIFFSRVQSELQGALRACRPGLIGVGVLTAALALLPVAAAIYVVLLFDVAMVSRSGATLAGIFALVVLARGVQIFLSALRDRMFGQIGETLSLRLGERVDSAIARSIETVASPGDGLQAARDLDAMRRFLAGRGASAMADLPAIGLLVLVMAVFHAWLAVVLLALGAIMIVLLVNTLRSATVPARAWTQATDDRNVATATGYRHAELLRVLGMGQRAGAARTANDRRLIGAESAFESALVSRIAAIRATRLIGDATILAVGGWLAIDGRASVGIVAAAALLADAALKPFENAADHARDYGLARLGWERLSVMLERIPAEQAMLPLPVPTESLAVEGVTLVAPDTRRVILRDISFGLRAGDAVAIVGGSAIGKTALLRALIGGWRPAAGKVRLDGGALDQWEPQTLGRHIGYLPQHPTLLDGTIAQNIARFDPAATSEDVIAAAKLAGVHDMIVRMGDGYATEVGDEGGRLSLGEQQRIALARALFGDPFLVVLDEPTAYADGPALFATGIAIKMARARGAIVVAGGAGKPVFDNVDKLLVLRDGRVQFFGEKNEVRQKLLESQTGKRPRTVVAGVAPVQE